MKILILFIVMVICAHAQEAKPHQPVKNSGLSLAAVPAQNDETHKDAVETILKVVGLSSTGNIYYVGKILPTFDIEGFCRSGESVLEYRTTHLFSQTMSVVWYNPTSKKLHFLYSQKTPNPSAQTIPPGGVSGL